MSQCHSSPTLGIQAIRVLTHSDRPLDTQTPGPTMVLCIAPHTQSQGQLHSHKGFPSSPAPHPGQGGQAGASGTPNLAQRK